MDNPHRGEVAIRAGGKVYVLSMSINAMCRIEAHFEKPLRAVAAMLNVPDPPAAVVRAFLWACLHDHHPNLTREEAGALIPDDGLQELFDAFGKVLARSFPQADESAEGNARTMEAAA